MYTHDEKKKKELVKDIEDGRGVVGDGDDRCQNTPCRVLPGLGLQFQLWSGQRCEQRA